MVYYNVISTLDQPLGGAFDHSMLKCRRLRSILLLVYSLILIQPDPVYEPCLFGKIYAYPFPFISFVILKPLEFVHSNLYGPLFIVTHSEIQY